MRCDPQNNRLSHMSHEGGWIVECYCTAHHSHHDNN